MFSSSPPSTAYSASVDWSSIDADNGLSPRRRQAIIWINAWVLLIGPLGTNFSEMLIEIYTLPPKKMHLKMSSGKWRPFCLGLNVLNDKQIKIPMWHTLQSFSSSALTENKAANKSIFNSTDLWQTFQFVDILFMDGIIPAFVAWVIGL